MIIPMPELFPLLTLLLLSLSWANGDNFECVGNEGKIIKGPESRSAQPGSDEVVRFDCVGCGPLLAFDITTVYKTDHVVCGPKDEHPGVQNMYFVVEQNDNDPLNCSLYINTTLLNVSEVLIQCELEDVGYFGSSGSSVNATLTMLKTESSSHSLPVSPTVTINKATIATLADAITSPTTTETTASSESTLGFQIAAPIASVLAVLIVIIAVFVVGVFIYRRCRKRPTTASVELNLVKTECKDGKGESRNGEPESEEQDSKRSKGKLGKFVQSDGGMRPRKRKG